MARTRSKPKSAPAKETTPEPPTSKAKPLPPSTTNPPKLFVLPKDTSSESRIVTLENPANGTPSRYYFCPNKGFYEFTRIAAPKKECKSWLITPDRTTEDSGSDAKTDLGEGYVTNRADLFLATPIDILLLVLPALAPKGKERGKQHFLSLEDHLDTLSSVSRQWRVLIRQYPTLKNMIERRMALVCDTVTAGDETMYRLSNEKLVNLLVKKAKRMCAQGLPASMEERFIKTALEVPVMNIRRSDVVTSTTTETPMEITQTTDSQTTTVSTLTRSESEMTTGTTIDSQITTSTAATSFTSATEEVIAKPALETPPEIPQLLRLRTCLTYLTHSYLSPSLHPVILSSSTPDFSSLDTHLTALAKLRTEALALRSISDNISRKRGYADDEGAVMEREEKKRKKEEEDKKKKSESLAIKKLKKADTSGMKKLSSFFTKAPKKS